MFGVSQALTTAKKARFPCFGVSGIRVTEIVFFERKAVTAGKEVNFRMIPNLISLIWDN